MNYLTDVAATSLFQCEVVSPKNLALLAYLPALESVMSQVFLILKRIEFSPNC